MGSTKKTKRRNKAKIEQLKKDLLAQQAKILEARKAVAARKDVYLVLKAMADMEPKLFENSLKGINKRNLEIIRAHLRAVENALSQLEGLPKYTKIKNATNPQLFHSVATGIVKLADDNKDNLTIEHLLDFSEDPEEVEKQYKAKINSLIEEINGDAEV